MVLTLHAKPLITALLAGSVAFGSFNAFAKDHSRGSGWLHNHYVPLTRLASDGGDPSGNTVDVQCSGSFSNANARIGVRRNVLGSKVIIQIRHAKPNTLFTFWLRLKGEDSQGLSFGASPLTNGGSTPLAASWSLAELLAATGSGNGQPMVANGVTTNSRGHATFRVQLDFPLFAGAYPFQNMQAFDPDDPRYPDSVALPRIYPVAIVDPRDPGIDAPFMIRMVSHCTDGLGHGLTPGGREPWFDYP